MIRILHLADVHLGASYSGFGEHAEARRDEVLAAFARLPVEAAAAEAHAVVVAGDLFDSGQPPGAVVALVRETFRRLVDDGRPVFIVPGNHDALTLTPNPYSGPFGGAHVFTLPVFGPPFTVETAGGTLHVYGVAYDRAVEPAPLGSFRRAAGGGVHVVVVHGSVPDSPHWGGSPNALSLPVAELAALHADYIALGDYHRFRPPAEFQASGGAGPPACYCGSFAALNRKETGARGWVLVELEPGQPPQVRHTPSGVRPVQDVGEADVTATDDEVEAARVVAARVDDGALPFVKLVGTPGYPLDAERVRAELATRFGHAWVRDESRFFASARLDELAREDTVVGHVVRLGRERVTEAEASGDAPRRDAAERALRLTLVALGVR